MTSKDKGSAHRARQLLLSGSELAGASLGGALGFLAGGPGGAAAAGALGVVIARSLAHAADKVMSHRERMRVGSVAAVALARIAERLTAGDQPRRDFFDEQGEMQPPGEQLLEGVLLKARDEYEEKKLDYIGRFYGNLVFTSNISAPVASFLLKTLERLTYRQMSMLALISASGKVDFRNLRSQDHSAPELEVLKREEMDLHSSDLGSLGLVRGAGPFDDELNALGTALVQLAELDRIPERTISELKALLAECPENKDVHFSSNG